MAPWVKNILKNLPHELRQFDRQWWFGLLVSVFAGLFVYTRVGREKFVNEYLSESLPYIKAFLVAGGVMLGFAIVRSAYALYKEADDRARGAEAEVYKLTERPKVNFKILDAFIVPTVRTASCFLHLSLHNSTDVPVSNPTASAYNLSLTIKGKEYQNVSFLDLKDYELRHYKSTDVYDDEGNVSEGQITLSVDGLEDIRHKQCNLVRGTPVEGWVGVAVHYLPEWETTADYIGTHAEWVFDEDGAPTGEIPVEDYAYIPHTKAVEVLTMTVRDAYRQKWSVHVSGPFSKPGKEITKKGVDLLS